MKIDPTQAQFIEKEDKITHPIAKSSREAPKIPTMIRTIKTIMIIIVMVIMQW